MQVKRIIAGALATNTYLIFKGEHVIIIDPASKLEKLLPYIQDKIVDAVLLTHGHFDHIKTVDQLYDVYHMPIILHEDDLELAQSEKIYQENMRLFGFSAIIKSPITLALIGSNHIGVFDFEIIHSPGHTMGSVLYLFDQDLFTGDTLFKNSVGRTDLYGGNNTHHKNSLRMIKEMNPDYIIHPGHEEESTLFKEINHNPFLEKV